MALYETTFIANQELTKKQLELLTDNFAEIVKANDGKVVKKEYWGLRNFAYPIKKQKRGYYIMLGLELGESGLAALEKKFKHQEEILKHLFIKVKELKKENSQLAKSDNE
jgi:small subunit ribosomal protein S6